MVHIYTDGACSGNPGKGGYGIVMEWAGKTYHKEFSEGFQMTTNNRMELLAVIVSLEHLKKEGTEVIIFSDSKYVVDAVEKKWVFNWEKKSYSGKKNADLWQQFLRVYRKHKVSFVWVKGHNSHKQNERCDELAVQAAQASFLKIDQGFEKEENAIF